MTEILKRVISLETDPPGRPGGGPRISQTRIRDLIPHLRQIAANLREIEKALQGLSDNDPRVHHCLADLEENRRNLREHFATLLGPLEDSRAKAFRNSA